MLVGAELRLAAGAAFGGGGLQGRSAVVADPNIAFAPSKPDQDCAENHAPGKKKKGENHSAKFHGYSRHVLAAGRADGRNDRQFARQFHGLMAIGAFDFPSGIAAHVRDRAPAMAAAAGVGFSAQWRDYGEKTKR